MTIGIIVEGQEESQSLAYVVEKITIKGVTIRKPLYASIEPKATPLQIAKSVESRLKILGQVNRILLLIDLENLDACPGERAQTLEQAVAKMGYHNVQVVIKNRKFENWLIADCEALKQLNLFKPTQSFIKQVTGKADTVADAVGLLSSIKTDKKSFHKTNDGTAIAKKAVPETIALHSRSFRRFLRLLNHEDYKNQSKKAKTPV
jgi:hypothetical protein